MAFGNWSDVIKIYQNTYLNTKYADHAQAMINLIPNLQSLPEFEDVLPGTTHGTLFLSLPDSRVTINIWYDSEHEYQVYFYHPEDGEDNKIQVSSEKIVSSIQNYVEQLRNMKTT